MSPDPKARWVDGTPEYSFGISGLRKLLPGARFIHLLRNCEDVAPSMVQLDRLAGTKLVAKGAKIWFPLRNLVAFARGLL